MKYNYSKLMNAEPTKLGELVNSQGQTITFLEHPFKGDESPVIACCHSLQLAQDTDFYELYDMTSPELGGEYEPVFIDGELWHGDFKV